MDNHTEANITDTTDVIKQPCAKKSSIQQMQGFPTLCRALKDLSSLPYPVTKTTRSGDLVDSRACLLQSCAIASGPFVGPKIIRASFVQPRKAQSDRDSPL